ncbi:MAG: pyridoxamine 5'-phosphate oxidase family protein [Bacteroidales bacterium]|nr:pyridoxamine 5'-phosphate oxidase family protein [Bacteroidales bacterium]
MNQAIEFLRKNNEVSFATCEDGKPRIRVFQIMKIEGKDLFFATSAKKAVYRQLQQNPFIEIMAFAGKISVKCSGRAVFDVDERTKQWIYDNNDVLPRLYNDYKGLDYFRMQIDFIDYYDLQPTPPVLKHIDMSTVEETDGFVGDKYSKQPLFSDKKFPLFAV